MFISLDLALFEKALSIRIPHTITAKNRLIIGVPGFVGAPDPDRRAVVIRADVFTEAAARTFRRIDVGPLDGFYLSVPVLNINVQTVDCFVRDGAMLFADHAVTSVGIRQASSYVEGGQPDACVMLLFQRKLGDGAGGADLPAEVAHIIAISDGGDEHRRPQAFQAGLGQGGLQASRRAGLDAHTATGAAL